MLLMQIEYTLIDKTWSVYIVINIKNRIICKLKQKKLETRN